MTWYLVAGGVALLSLLLLAAVLLVTWRKVKALSSQVSRAGDAVGQATAALEQAQAAGPLGARPGTAGTTSGA